MHVHKIIHRDIKAENIVFRDTITAAAAKGGPPVVKFIDLGMSTYYDPDHPEQGGCPQNTLHCLAHTAQKSCMTVFLVISQGAQDHCLCKVTSRTLWRWGKPWQQMHAGQL